jgi:D-alanyl-D-alanine carboxypeptidase
MTVQIRVILLAALAAVSALYGQLPPADSRKIDAIAEQTLRDTQAPSVSIAVVKDGKIAYLKAFGNARLDPPTPARPEMHYCIGSVSKQFLAAAILLLVEDGKLSLDDPVSRYLPDLTRANEVTIRELLSHTSGYQDYYPLDYVAPYMLKPVTAPEILDRWARKPLDFEPGTRWQYSNTNFVAAGRIVERVTGVPLMSFLEARIFKPLAITDALDLAQHPLTGSDAAGYTRFASAPVRPVPAEGPGWLFAAGELGLTGRDLALWDISLMDHTLLKPASFDAMITPVRLKDGAPTDYALGIGISNVDNHPKLSHGGAYRDLSLRTPCGRMRVRPWLCSPTWMARPRPAASPTRSHRCWSLRNWTRTLPGNSNRRAASSATCSKAKSIARCSRPMRMPSSRPRFSPMPRRASSRSAHHKASARPRSNCVAA